MNSDIDVLYPSPSSVLSPEGIVGPRRALFDVVSTPQSVVCISALEGPLEKSDNFTLPGKGQRGEGCGSWFGKHCEGHDGAYWGRTHCNERSCPDCSERWGKKEADEASKKVAWRAHYWELQMQKIVVAAKTTGTSPLDPIWLFKRGLVGHFIVSMPADLGLWVPGKTLWHYDGLLLHGWDETQARRLAYAVCRRHGISGGVVIFHPWRRDDDDNQYVPDGYWHFHVIGLHLMATTPGGTDPDFPDGSGLVFKHIKDEEYGNYGGIRSQRGISRVLQYQLSHAGLKEGSQALTYFGLLHHSMIPKEKLERTYPLCLEDDGKTDPRSVDRCPICGSKEVESCIQTEIEYVRTRGEPGEHFAGIGERLVHAEPIYKPTPEKFDEEKTNLEAEFQNLYDEEPVPSERHKLTKDRQTERARLASRELEFCNLNDPLMKAWFWLKTMLENGPVRVDLLVTSPSKELVTERAEVERAGLAWTPPPDDSEILQKCIDLNIRHGRLGITPSEEYLFLEPPEYDLDQALRDVRGIVKAPRGPPMQDPMLERLLRARPGPRDDILTDEGYIFGPLLDKYRNQCLGASE